MAQTKTLTFVSRKNIELPVMTRGREPVTSPRLSVTANGQFSFNKLVAPIFEGAEKVILAGIDQETGKIELRALTDKLSKAFESKKVNVDVDYYTYTLHTNSKTQQVTIAGTQLAKFLGYDYKASGNQYFAVETDQENATVTFTLPKGAMTPKPKQERKARVKKSENVVTIPVTATATAGTASGEEVVLEG